MELIPQTLIDNFHFLRPLFLLGLLPALLLFLFLRYLQGNQSNWTRAIDPSLLPYLLDKTMTPAQSYPLYGLLTIWVLAFVAMAGPVWEEIPAPVQEREDALVIVLDLSMSMYATDLRPNRITRAQRKIIDILEYRRQEGQTGMVVYAGDAHAVTPMTDDVETINNLVSSLQPSIMPVLGSKPALGVNLAMDLMANSSLTSGHILLLTDSILDSDIPGITDLLRGTEHRLSVMGFGTEEGAPIPLGQQGYLRDASNAIVIPRLDRGPLQLLASQGGGRYADAQLTDDDVLFLLEENRFEENDNLVAVDDREFDTWNEAGPWLLLLILPMAAMGFRRGWLLGLFALMIMHPDRSAYAFDWDDLWVNKDNQGLESFNTEAFTQAAEDFENPQWRAAANYRNQNYEAAAQDLTGIDTPDAHYNLGNALAHLEQYEAAIEAYDTTLAQIPDHADALKNKAIVEKLLEEQQQQQQEQENSESDQQQEQQDGDQQDQENQQQSQNQDQQQQQDNQEQQDGDQQDQEQQDQEQQDQQQESEEENDSEQEEQDQEQQPSESDQPNNEEQQAMQQWLMRIPDDPGELLRNKFQYQTQQQLLQQLQNPALGQPKPGDPLW